MNSLRLRILFPLWLFGFLPAMGATRMMGQPLEWFFGITGVLLGGGVFLAAYLISGWLLKPTTAVMKGTTAVLRGVPPDAQSAEWLPSDFWKLRCDINMIFAKQRQALNAAEQHACQTAQRLLNAERLLREAFTALQGLFSASDEGVAVVDAQGSIIASNSRLDDLLGKPVEEAAGRDAKRLLTALTERFQDQNAVTGWIEKAAASLDGQDETAPFATTDGRVFSLRSNPMRTDAGEVIGRIWIIKDRSEMRVLENQLRESQKMGTIGQLAGGIAHDFNNLLTAIRGNLTLAELTPASNAAAVRDKLQNANHATTRAAELVKSLLGYSRRSTGTSIRKTTNLKRLLADVQNLLKHSVDPRVTIQMRGGMDPSYVKADGTQVEQVMLNLCLNARDALPADKGVIEIAVENVTHRNPAKGGEVSDFVMLVVRDNGRGISEEHRQRIFEPFFTTKNGSTGTGLGLSTAQDIVRDHGGWIEFDSELGRGSEFRVFLPRVLNPEQLDDEGPVDNGPAIAAPAGGQTTILVVDDEAPVRSIATNMLGFLGYRVLEAGDGQQALDIILRSGEKIDAVLLDIYMPKLSGRDTFKELRSVGNDVPVVVCSGFVIDPDEFMILSQGHPPPVDIMLKPYSLDGLSKALAKAVQKPQGSEPAFDLKASRTPLAQPAMLAS
ncbi:MAG: response regulator [Prosthecobacter sp.]|uniref:hybrid sensor histidine kinase/response regulator n=1 Tax=Prosthecobacter sp. TaxID=1965333 RepID=UPI0019E57F7A|nr:ATP-binding protein [Prosthecobacter sp.]MBE2282385.1 response regulator [Prosthecobacter sp.]